MAFRNDLVGVLTLLTFLNFIALVVFMRTRSRRWRTICVVMLVLVFVAHVVCELALIRARQSVGELLVKTLEIPPEIPESVFGLLQIENHHCRLKVVCETSKFISEKNAGFSSVFRVMTDLVSVESEFFKGATHGLLGLNCSSLYEPCDQRIVVKDTFPFIQTY